MKICRSVLFPYERDTYLHRIPVWTELREFHLERWVREIWKTKKHRVDSEGSCMSEAARSFFGKESILLEPICGQAHWQTRLLEVAIPALEAPMTATALEHPDMGAHECLARAVAASNPGKMCGDTHQYNTRWEEPQICTADSTHQNTRHFGCRTLRSTSSTGRNVPE